MNHLRERSDADKPDFLLAFPCPPSPSQILN